jgi:NADPH:quinone reductase-like Zn-dependent oxidoreductase
MKAIVQSQYGEADVLSVATLERPQPKEDEVLVRVKAAGIDYGVWHLMSGKPYIMRLGTGLFAPRERQLGMDVSGVIEAVGAAVTRFKVGDEVFGAARRTFAEFTCAREDELVLKPSTVSFEEAAAAPVSGVTALMALRAAGVKPGQRLCILGAGGGVGSWAVQLAARHFGAMVTGVCSTSKVDFVRSLGAQHVLDYTREALPADGRFDAIVDLAGSRALGTLRKSLAPNGTLVLAGGEGDHWFGGMGRSLRAALWSLFSKQKMKMLLALVKPEPLQTIASILQQGAIKPAVDRTFSLEQAAEGLRALTSKAVKGKLVLSVSRA